MVSAVLCLYATVSVTVPEQAPFSAVVQFAAKEVTLPLTLRLQR